MSVVEFVELYLKQPQEIKDQIEKVLAEHQPHPLLEE